ncbi:swt1 RNA endoribonuclease isoform X2 [Dermacentor variabilis]|uniref:swt1 RNA endoribonuclease isoform X2 n=1 Tax=Dermacentor variabilis TaxID=34621 RepID=UPI003F5B1FE7
MDQKEASKGVPHETRRVSAKGSAAVGGLAADGKADQQSPCEDRKAVGKRSVKTAVRRLLPSLSSGVRDPSPMHRNSQQFESDAPEAEGKNPPATSTPSSSYNVLGSIISTSTAEPIVERLFRRAPAKEAPSKDTTTGKHQQGDAEKPRKSLKEALLSKMMALFGGSGLSATARDTATAAPMPSTSRGSVEPLGAKRPRGSREENLQGPGSLFGGLPAVSDGIETGPSQAPRPSKRPATGFHGPSASGAAHYWQQATPGSGMPRAGPGPSWCFLAPPAESGTSIQDGVSPLQGEVIVEDVEMEDLTDAFDESLNEQGPLTDYKGTYVVTDTNIFLSNLGLLKRILLPDTGNEDMVLCVSWMAIQELDSIKTKKKGPLSSSAASAIMFIYQALSTKNPRLRGQTVVEARRKDDVLPKDGCSINDDHFLHWCLEFKKQGNKVLLLSNDCNLRNKAMINSIDTMSADQMEKKLGPPTTKEGHKQTPLPTLSTEKQKPSALLSQHLELRPRKFSSRSSQKLPLPPDVLQKQKDASKEASATSNTTACDVSPQVPVGDTILMEVREILRESLNLTLQSELESAFGTLWLRVAEIKPPWTEESALQCILRHWISLTGTAFSKSTLKPVISALLSKLSKNPGSSEVLQITDLAIQLCSEMQCHYPQLAENVARLEKLSGDLLGLQQAAAAGSAARRHDSDGKKETSARPRPPPPRNPGRSMPINHRLVNLNEEPTVDYVHRPPHVILMASINEARYQAEYRAEEERKRNPDAPLPPHIPPGRPHIINRFPLRPPMDAVKRRLELHRQQPLSLPPPPPENTPPVALFQESWSVINDYCGFLCSKTERTHEFPYIMRAAYKIDRAVVRKVYRLVVHVTDYMTVLLNELDKGRENLVGLAEALIVALAELLRTLRHESIPADKTWRVDLDEMLDFLMEPRHKNLLAVGKLQIVTLHNSLAQCALNIMSPNFKPSP